MIEGIEDLPEAVKRFIPNYEYLFFDFSPYSAAEIRGGVELRIFISIVNAMFKEEEEFLSTVARSLQALEELGRGQKATDYLETMVRYIISAASVPRRQRSRRSYEPDRVGTRYSFKNKNASL